MHNNVAQYYNVQHHYVILAADYIFAEVMGKTTP